MTVAQDKRASVEFITDSVTLKDVVGREIAKDDATNKLAQNIVAAILFNGSHADSTGTRYAIPILVGSTAPTNDTDYVNSPPGSIFIQVSPSGTAAMMYFCTANADGASATWSEIGDVT